MSSAPPSNNTVLILFFCLVALIILLIFLYKKLNKEADGQYTVRRMVYKEGGVRDRMRGAVLALETRLGVQLWPRSSTDEDGEEMQDVRDEEGEVEEGSSQRSDSEGDDQEKDEEEDAEHSERGGTSDDNSSLVSSEPGEQTRLQEPPKGKGDTGIGEEKEEKAGNGEGKAEASGRAGLSLNLNQLSGSAIWFEEEGGKESDVTAL